MFIGGESMHRKSNKVPQSAREAKKAELQRNGLDVSKMAGRDSYAYKAINLGVYEDIEFLIIEFFDKYPNGTNMQLYQMLHEKYSDVFDKEPNDMYSGNITKMICSSSGWKRAYEYSMEKSVLRSKYYAHCVVTDNSEEAKVRLQASDKIVNWDLSEKKLALEKRKLDLLEKSSSGGNSDSISNETNNTLNLIVEGLKELGDDNE